MDDSNYDDTLRGGAIEPVMTAFDVNPSAYADEIAEMNISEDQARELLATLWEIMRDFVELGFTADICGQIFGADSALLLDTADGVDSAHTPQTRTPDSGDKGDADA